MSGHNTRLLCLAALLTTGTGCSAITDFNGLTGGDTGAETLDAYVPPGVDASIDAARAPDTGRDAYVPPGVDANIDAAAEPDAGTDAYMAPDAYAARDAPDAYRGDAGPESCRELFRNPATVPPTATGLTLVQTLSGTSGADRLADMPGHAENMTGLALTASEAVASQWNGYAMRYTRDGATGRLTFVADHYIGENTTGVVARRDGSFLTTAAYRYARSVPLIRAYPTSAFEVYQTGTTFSGLGALTTAGDDFRPVPGNIWGVVEAPSGMLYAAAQGRAELRTPTVRDTRILRIEPAFPALPDGVDRTDAAGLGGDSAFLALRALDADDRYLYWVTGVDARMGADPFPAAPHRLSRARFNGCGTSLDAATHIDVSATSGITALAVHPDGRVFAGSPLGITIFPSSWTGPGTLLPLPHVQRVQDMQFSPDGNRLILAGTVGTIETRNEQARILVINTSTPTPTVLRTYGPGTGLDGTFPEFFRPGAIRLYGPHVYIGSHFAASSATTGTPNMHVFTWTP